MDPPMDEPGQVSSYAECDDKTWDYIKTQFLLFDKDKSDSIPITELGNALRMCGQTPFETEIEDLKGVADPNGSGIVKWEDFKTVLEECTTLYQRGAEDLAAAVHAFLSEPRGYINVDQLRFMLTMKGDKLSDEEMNELLEELKTETDNERNIPILSIVEKLMPEYMNKD